MVGAAACTGTVEDAAPGSTVGAGSTGVDTPVRPGEPEPLPGAASPATPPTGAPPVAPGSLPPPPFAHHLPAQAPAPLRRLTHGEYDNTVRDLLGDPSRPASAFTPETLAFRFANNAAAQTVPPSLAEDYFDAAEAIAARAVARLPALVPCSATPDAACAASFITGFGKRAWRRPLTAAEVERLTAVFKKGEARRGFAGGADLVLRALLLSPAFLFRIEAPATPAARPSSWEMASRLSYLLWASMPDDALLAAAERDELRAPEKLAAQVTRMLADPRAKDAVRGFHAQWLGLHELPDLDKDTKLLPKWSAAIGPLLAREIETFTTDAVLTSNLSVDGLLGGAHSFLDAKLAAFYGVTGPKGAAFEKVSLDPARRAGLLTMAGLLAVNALRDQSSPTRRGIFVREQLLCMELPPPPPTVDNNVPPVAPASTTRQRFEQHATNPSCAGCHVLTDAIGFAFESYDAAGLWRDADGGKPVDASGEIVGTDVAGKVTGAVELARRLGGSADVRACIARQWFRFAFGRDASTADAPALERLSAALGPGGSLRKLLGALTESPPFLTTRGGTP